MVMSRSRGCGWTQWKVRLNPPPHFCCVHIIIPFVCAAGRASGGILLFAARAPNLHLGEILLGLLEHVPNDAARTAKSAVDEARKASCSREWRSREGWGFAQ